MSPSPSPWAISHSSLKYDGKEMQMNSLKKKSQIGFWQMYKDGGSGHFKLFSLYFMLFQKNWGKNLS